MMHVKEFKEQMSEILELLASYINKPLVGAFEQAKFVQHQTLDAYFTTHIGFTPKKLSDA